MTTASSHAGQLINPRRTSSANHLAVAESKARVKQLLVAALDDWTGLAAFRPSTRARTASQ